MATRKAPISGKGARIKTSRESGVKPLSAQSRTDSGLADSDEYSSDDLDSHTQKQSLSKKTSRSVGKKDGKVKVPIDLTNPDDLLDKMDKLQLTEEETEELLKQAYSINRKLKQQMSDENFYASSRAGKSASSRQLPPIGQTQTPHKKRQHSGSSSGSRISAKSRRKPEWVD